MSIVNYQLSTINCQLSTRAYACAQIRLQKYKKIGTYANIIPTFFKNNANKLIFLLFDAVCEFVIGV